MEILEVRFGVAKGKLSRIHEFVQSTVDAPVEAFSTRLQMLELAWCECNDLFNKIVGECEADQRSNFVDQFVEMEALYLTAKTEFARRINSAALPQSHSNVPTAHPHSSDVKLPRISIPTFSGDYLDWNPFRDMFSSLVHNNANISPAQKLHYLKSSLSGEAATLLHSLEVTDAHYVEAWELLNNRYQNKRQLIQCHMKALFGQNPVKGESVAGIRKLIDTTNRHVRALKALEVNTDEWSHVLVFLISERLDPETRKEWELVNTSKEFPKFDELKAYLEKRCHALEASQGSSGETPEDSLDLAKGGHKSKPSSASVLLATSIEIKKAGCALCKGRQHPAYKCSVFLRCNAKERFLTAKKHALCFNCLAQNHSSQKCPSTPFYRNCNGHNHTLLHFGEHEKAVEGKE